jgi:hypothetical protein
MWRRLIRLAFTRGRRSQEQRFINGIAQALRRQDISAQVRNHNLLVHDSVVRSDPSSVRRQCDVDNSICETKGRGIS